MTWLQIALGLIGLATWLTRTLASNKTFDAGQQQAVADALKRASDEVSAALEAGRKAEDDAGKGKYDPGLFRDEKK